MESAHPEIPGCFRIDNFSNSFFHLTGSFVCECQCKDIPGRDTLCQQVGDTVCQYSCFTRSSTCNHKSSTISIKPIVRDDGLPQRISLVPFRGELSRWDNSYATSRSQSGGVCPCRRRSSSSARVQCQRLGSVDISHKRSSLPLSRWMRTSICHSRMFSAG